MQNINLEELCMKTVAIVKEVGNYIRTARTQGFDVEEKSLNSLVTQIDKSSEKQLVEKLLEIVEDAGIIGEENIANKTSDELNWIIDPLDGTTNFIHGVPCYSVSVALMNKDDILIGVVYEINLDECFYAWKNGGTHLNGKAITCSSNDTMKDALIATGFPYYDFEQMDAYLKLFRDFMHKTRGLRRLGSAAVDLAYVADGRFDGFYENKLNAWDVAAGALIVREAGGKVTDFSGKSNYVFGEEIAACSSALFDEFLATINVHFNEES